MIGTTVGHYEIIEKLGAGGMGIVYKARDINLDRIVALKFLPSSFDDNSEQRLRFIHEAKAASAIDHPNVASVYEIGEAPSGQMFIAMAYCDGPNLKSVLSNGPLSIEDAVQWAIHIVRGLGEAHKHNIIHRDLKPHNILTTSGGAVKIIDFGLAKIASAQTQLTREGTTVGTISYMSPEQARGDQVGLQSDIWSLGVIIFEMVTGRPPFQGEYDPAIIYNILNQDAPSLRTVRPDAPSELEDIVTCTLQKNPKDRYGSAADLLADLEAIAVHRSAVSSSTSRSNRADRNPRRRSTIRFKRLAQPSWAAIIRGKLLVVALVVAVVFVAGFFLIRSLMGGMKIHPSERTLVVLPFRFSGNQDEAYISYGLTKDLTDALGRRPTLSVLSQQTAALFTNSTSTADAIGDSLGFRFVLSGNIAQQGKNFIVQATLIDSKDGSEIWSAAYFFDHDQILTATQQLVNPVAEIFDLPDGSPASTVRMPAPEVYRAYMRGLYHVSKSTKTDDAIALAYFADASRKDSLFLPARLRRASVLALDYEAGWNSSQSALQESEQIARSVLQMDSTSAEGLITLGIIEGAGGKKVLANTLFRRALRYDKTNPVALTRLAASYMFDLGEPATGTVYLKQLQDSDPTNWQVASNVGIAYGLLKDYRQAAEAFLLSLRYNPENEDAWNNLGYVYERLTKYDSAIVCYDRAIDKDSSHVVTYENLASVLNAFQRHEEALKHIQDGMRHLDKDPTMLYLLGITNSFLRRNSDARRAYVQGMAVLDEKILRNSKVADYHADRALFAARMRESHDALVYMQNAMNLDSSNSLIIIKAARVNAILGRRDDMLSWFRRAHAMNPEFDAAYLVTAIDFERYRNDPSLLAVTQ